MIPLIDIVYCVPTYSWTALLFLLAAAAIVLFLLGLPACFYWQEPAAPS